MNARKFCYARFFRLKAVNVAIVPATSMKNFER